METNKILSADLLDLIFDDRNKAYGAYELRRTYDKRVKKALILTGTLALLAFSGTLLANNMKPVGEKKLVIVQHDFVPIKPDEKPVPPPPPPPRARVEPPPQVRMEKLTSEIVITETPKEPIPDQKALNDAEIGNKKIDIPKTGGEDIIRPTDVDGCKGCTGIIPDEKLPPGDFIKVEEYAKFDGNWRKFLENTLRADVPTSNGAPVGSYTVDLQFVVNTEGIVSDIKALNKIGYGMEDEAIRVLKRSKKWRPAIQNGHPVPITMTQKITFIVSEG
jgi:protein TonB